MKSILLFTIILVSSFSFSADLECGKEVAENLGLSEEITTATKIIGEYNTSICVLDEDYERPFIFISFSLSTPSFGEGSIEKFSMNCTGDLENITGDYLTIKAETSCPIGGTGCGVIVKKDVKCAFYKSEKLDGLKFNLSIGGFKIMDLGQYQALGSAF